MFGYIMVNKEALTEQEVKRFSAYYCGLCHALGQRYGRTGQLALSFDMAFLALVLSSLYEPETTSGTGRCIVHPTKRHDYTWNPLIDYAADMTIALAYHKALDDWGDDRNLAARSQARVLKSRYRRIASLYPRQTAAMERGLSELRALEGEEVGRIDPPANAFGSILAELFVCRKDLWSDTLRQMGASLGRFIYLLDAYDDLNADVRKGRYNPLIPLMREDDFEDRVHRYLTLMIGDATVAFEQLPLVEDVSILRNILYSGVWTKYQLIRKRRADTKGAHP